MTRSFSKATTDSPLKLTALCVAIALGWMVHGAPGHAEADTELAMDIEMVEMAMAHIC